MEKAELILGTFDQHFNLLLQTSGKDVIVPQSEGAYESIYNPLYLMLGSRLTLDKNPGYTHIRQLIPYVIVRCGEDIAIYSRTKQSTESRLHDKLSIGFGGHIDLDDIVANNSLVDVKQTVINSCYRELYEELNILHANVVERAPSLNADGEPLHRHIVSKEDAVGTVHLGLLYIVDIKDRNDLVIEPELNFVGWFSESYIRANVSTEFSGLEGWSMAVINSISNFSEIPVLPYPGE